MPAFEGVPSNIVLQTGPLFLGTVFAYGLYGILVVQLFLYFHRFSDDARWIKAPVLYVFFIDTVVTILATIATWNSVAKGWGNLDILHQLDWPIVPMPLLSGSVASCVHFFYCWRIYKLRGSVVIPIFIATISLLAWSMASYCGIIANHIGHNMRLLKPYALVWLSGSTLVDVLITACMLYTFIRAKTRSEFSVTDALVQKLITLTIETGMATAAVALSDLILFLCFPNTNMHFLACFMISQLYSNTLLATLNARAYITRTEINIPSALWKDTSGAFEKRWSHRVSMSTMRRSRPDESSSQTTKVHDLETAVKFSRHQSSNSTQVEDLESTKPSHSLEG